MFRFLGRGRSFVAHFVLRPVWRVLRAVLLAFACAGPPMPAHEIRGRTPAVQHDQRK